MDSLQVAHVLREAIPSHDLGIRLIVIFLASIIAHMVLRGLAGVVRATALSASILVLTLIATFVGAPWGLADKIGSSRQVDAWFVFWSAVLLIRLVDYVFHAAHSRKSDEPPMPVLLRRTVTAVLYLVSAICVLKFVLGVDITPLLATSAILTMVIGLALQGVLGNLLSGVSLGLVRTVEVGNLIAVGDREGIVVHTNWRETILRTRDDDYMHVPNSILASERIVNYSKPEQLHRHHMDVGASYSDAPADVIEALEEAAREATQIVKSPAPRAHLTGYLDFGINYRLYFWSRNYWRRNRIQGEVGRLIWYKFKRRGIEIPFPMSDQLLNDFMAVVYNQRRLPPTEEDVSKISALLGASKFLARAEDDLTPTPPPSLLSREAIDKLARACRFVRFTKGETLCRQGDSGDECYLVADGSIAGDIEYKEGGRTHRFEFRTSPGELFGEMSLFTGMQRTATGRIDEETTLLEIPRDAFARLLAENESVMTEIATLVADRNEQNREFLEKIESLPPQERADSCDSGKIMVRLKKLASLGKKLLGGQ